MDMHFDHLRSPVVLDQYSKGCADVTSFEWFARPGLHGIFTRVTGPRGG